MKIRNTDVLYVLFTITVIGIQMQDVITVFSPTFNKTMGVLMAALLVLILFSKGNHFSKVISTEIILWISFLVWAGITGLFLAKVTSTFSSMMLYLAQQTLVIMTAILLIVMDKSVKRVALVIFMVPLIFIIYLFLSGQSNYILSLTKDYSANYLGKLLNANSIALWNLTGLIAYFIIRPMLQRRWSKVFCLLAAILYVYVIIQSGSRKTFLATCLFLTFVYLFNRVFNSNVSAAKFVSILGLVFLLYVFVEFLLPNILADTYLGQRLLNFSSDGSNQKRVELIIEALGCFVDSPIFGIGINQFQYYSSFGYYSHCDIAEVLCSTGLIGAVLYVSIYVLSIRKLLRGHKIYKTNNNPQFRQAGTMLAGLITMVFISVGNVSFESMTHWLIMSVFIGYTQICIVDGKRPMKQVACYE